jgi:RNA polymerase sigma-70 factor (ECF subfamily)
MITQVDASVGTAGSEALAELCARYRYPVYAYLRRSGHAPAPALAIATRFLDELQRDVGELGPPAGRHFRRFLLEHLERHLARGAQPTDADPAGEAERSDLLEARYARDAARAESPAQAFQRGFAVDVLLGAFVRLREEAEATGHGGMYAALAPYFARDPLAHEYDALATALHVRPITVAVALNRLRQRLHELAGEELADTVSSTAELAGEQAAMLAALRETG